MRQPVAANGAGRETAVAMTTDAFMVTRVPSTRGARIMVSGELGIATAPQLREECERQHPEDVAVALIDRAAVTFIDSTGLHALIAAMSTSAIGSRSS